MIDNFTLKRLNELGDRLEELQKPLRVERYMAPVNRDEEKQKLLTAHAHSEPYNPQFTFRATPEGWDKPLREFSHDLDSKASVWEQWLYRDAEKTLQSLRAAETHDPASITEISLDSYGRPSPNLIEAAHEVLATKFENPQERTTPTQEVAEYMREALAKARLTEWTVIVDEAMNARMSVRGVEKQVKIREGEFFTPRAIKRLLVHEIGTHVFRSVNGNAQPLRVLRLGLEGYLATEEGLATYHENRYGVQDSNDQRRYALRVLAAHMSLSGSFYDAFAYIAQHTTIDEAFEIVVRAKRGFQDTSVRGSHVKDIVYLQGLLMVSAHLQENPSDYPFLMSGKVSLEMLPILKELQNGGQLDKPRYLPEMLMVQFMK